MGPASSAGHRRGAGSQPNTGRWSECGDSGRSVLLADVQGTDLVDVFRLGLLRVVQVPAELQIHPEVRRGAEEPGQPQGCTRRDAASTAHDLVDALEGDMDGCGEVALGQAKRQQKLLPEHLARVGRRPIGWNADHVLRPNVQDIFGVCCLELDGHGSTIVEQCLIW